jgi:hypothetical protein
MSKKIHEFNQFFSVDFVLQLSGAVPNRNAPPFIHNSRWLYPEYSILCTNGVWMVITIRQRQDGSVEIITPNGLCLNNAFEVYRHFKCGDDLNLALQWKKHLALSNVPRVRPLIDINKMVDNSNHYQCHANLVACLISSQSLFQRMAENLSKGFYLPINTVALLQLGIFSAMAGKYADCAYPDGKKASIHLYTIAEHSSATGKSRFLNALMEPMLKMIRQKVKTLRSKLDAIEEELFDLLEFKDKEDSETKALRRKLKDLKKELAEVENLLPISDTTPEALEALLAVTNGTFSAATSEMKLLDSLLGNRKNQVSDVLLTAREGGEVKSNRISRNGYSGYVSGSFTCFAQEGCILKLNPASDVSGLFARFLPIAEDDMIGQRDHANTEPPNTALLEEYELQCQFFEDVLNKRFDHERLITLHITPQDWSSIHHFENSMEAHLAAGQVYSHPIMRRFIGKSRLQIMGIASNLYLFNVDPKDMPSNCYSKHYIPSEYVLSAIYMMQQFIGFVYSYCINNGIINSNEHLKVVYDLFAKHDTLTMHEIKSKCEKLKAFNGVKLPRKFIENIVHYLAQNYVLLTTSDSTYIKNPEPFGVM